MSTDVSTASPIAVTPRTLPDFYISRVLPPTKAAKSPDAKKKDVLRGSYNFARVGDWRGMVLGAGAQATELQRIDRETRGKTTQYAAIDRRTTKVLFITPVIKEEAAAPTVELPKAA